MQKGELVTLPVLVVADWRPSTPLLVGVGLFVALQFTALLPVELRPVAAMLEVARASWLH